MSFSDVNMVVGVSWLFCTQQSAMLKGNHQGNTDNFRCSWTAACSIWGCMTCFHIALPPICNVFCMLCILIPNKIMLVWMWMSVVSNDIRKRMVSLKICWYKIYLPNVIVLKLEVSDVFQKRGCWHHTVIRSTVTLSEKLPP